MRFLFVALFVSAVLALCGSSGNSAMYKVMFTSSWRNAPRGGQFTRAPIYAHDDTELLWAPGKAASPALSLLARTGDSSQFEQDITNMGLTYSVLYNSAQPLNDSYLLTNFMVTSEKHWVSMASMVSPSPDWFIGLSGMDLCSNGQFANNMTMDLTVYDAGVRSGNTFQASNSVVRGVVSDRSSQNPTTGVFGKVVFMLVNPDSFDSQNSIDSQDSVDSCGSGLVGTYQVTFTPMWQEAPTGAAFTRAPIAAHRADQTPWTVGDDASTGLSLLARTGDSSLFEIEISNQGLPHKVLFMTSGPMDSPYSINNLMVTSDMHWVSMASRVSPSPDWFVGLSGFDLCSDGKLVSQRSVNLKVYDAGTRVGNTFAASSNLTSDVIRDRSNQNPTVGTFASVSFTLMSMTTRSPSSTPSPSRSTSASPSVSASMSRSTSASSSVSVSPSVTVKPTKSSSSNGGDDIINRLFPSKDYTGCGGKGYYRNCP